MDELPADLKAFLLNHPFLQLTDAKKVSELIAPNFTKHTVQCDASCDANVYHVKCCGGWLHVLAEQPAND